MSVFDECSDVFLVNVADVHRARLAKLVEKHNEELKNEALGAIPFDLHCTAFTPIYFLYFHREVERFGE